MGVENTTAAYIGTGILGSLAIIKAISVVIRGWTGDRTGDKADKTAANQLDALEKENISLRAENNNLREAWQKLVIEEANLSASIRNRETKIIEQNLHISKMSRLIVYLIRAQSGDNKIPADMLPVFLDMNPEDFTEDNK